MAKIADIRCIRTRKNGTWTIVKVLTDQDGLYGLGSATDLYNPEAVVQIIEQLLAPLLIGRDAGHIEDLWQSMHLSGYWRNGALLQTAIGAVDVALWDIKGKEAGMPVYQLLGGACRSAVPCYGHAGGADMSELKEDVRRYLEQGYTVIRAQLGGYGGGGFVPLARANVPVQAWAKEAVFDEQAYVNAIPSMFEELRIEFGPQVQFTHDVHEHLSPIQAIRLAKRLEPYAASAPAARSRRSPRHSACAPPGRKAGRTIRSIRPLRCISIWRCGISAFRRSIIFGRRSGRRSPGWSSGSGATCTLPASRGSAWTWTRRRRGSCWAGNGTGRGTIGRIRWTARPTARWCVRKERRNMRTMKTIAVTGGSGKLGRYAVRELLRRQYDVFSLDHRIAPDLPCRQIQTDMQDFGQVAGALQGADAVLHLAAVPAPVGYPHHILFANNVLGSFHVLEAASLLGIRKVVMGSSTSAYGFAWARKPVSPAYFPVDESHPHLAQEGYGLSKTVGELAAGMFHRRSGLGVVNLRFSLIAEPEEYARLREGMSRPASFQKFSGATSTSATRPKHARRRWRPTRKALSR